MEREWLLIKQILQDFSGFKAGGATFPGKTYPELMEIASNRLKDPVNPFNPRYPSAQTPQRGELYAFIATPHLKFVPI